MRCLINEEGRECNSCNVFKQWDEYRNHKKGARGRYGRCVECDDEIRYLKKHGCLKEDNIDLRHYDADEIMDKLNRRKYLSKLKQLKSVFSKKSARYCQTCGDLKEISKYKVYEKKNKHSSGYAKVCNDCKTVKQDMDTCPIHNIKLKTRKDKYCDRKCCSKCEYSRKVERKKERIKEAIELAGDSSDISNGFIYLYRCEELDCFKIGRTKDNPFDYTKIKSSSSNGNYGIELKMVAYIVSPVRDCEAEWLATIGLKHKRVEYKKPCGGYAHELFRCGLYEALLILRGISNKMYIEPNPFVTLEDLDAVEIKTIPLSKRAKRKLRGKTHEEIFIKISKKILSKYKDIWRLKYIDNKGKNRTKKCDCLSVSKKSKWTDEYKKAYSKAYYEANKEYYKEYRRNYKAKVKGD